MTEEEKASFLRNANRAPGKRTIKPTKHFFHEVPDDEDDDNDWEAHSDADNGNDNGSSSGSSDGEDEDDDDDSNETSKSPTIDIDDDSLDSKDVKTGILSGDHSIQKKQDPERCCVCLMPQTDELALSKCDRCGIVVHILCHGVNDEGTESVASNTEIPWFCDPCMFGLVDPPYCVCCPSRFGAFKKTDVGENWVHIVCGQYIPKITYADNVNFNAISTEEVDFRLFGKKPCHACIDDPINSRIGITVPCEAGMCKHNFHVTCAQRLGLLVELEEGENVGHLFCKRHTLSEDLKRRKKRFENVMTYEEKRLLLSRRKILGEYDRRQKAKQLATYNRIISSLNNINFPGPASTKRYRMIQTSAEIIEGFANKAEKELGIDRDRFAKELCKIPSENLNLNGAISFTDESVRYFEYRENVAFDEQEQYAEELAVNKEEALQKEQDVKADIEKIKAGHDSILTSSKQTSDLCTAFIDILQPLCAKGISRAHLRLPHKHPAKPIVKPSDSSHKPKNIPKSKTKAPSKQKLKDKPPKLQASPIKSNTTNGSPEVVTLSDDEPPQLNNESSRYASQMPSTSTKHGIKRPVSDTNYENEVAGYCPPPPISKKPRKRAKTPGDDVPKICFTCKKEDVQQMPFCVLCKHHFHIQCLDPPLAKMPRAGRGYAWTCADCDEAEREKFAEVF